ATEARWRRHVRLLARKVGEVKVPPVSPAYHSRKGGWRARPRSPAGPPRSHRRPGSSASRDRHSPRLPARSARRKRSSATGAPALNSRTPCLVLGGDTASHPSLPARRYSSLKVAQSGLSSVTFQPTRTPSRPPLRSHLDDRLHGIEEDGHLGACP